ncbi:hypothetical protein key_124 [Erwinia phage KEY]|uniref:Uncharacterized protein n=1 Tax=Erwinia phage KEY TaxID=2821255 RepID=A0AAE7WB19_9CAUD|nr:hypothetical protein key_124 [Erwinia phage KEY]
MSFHLTIYALLIVHQVTFFVLLAIFMMMTITFIIRSNLTAKATLFCEKVLFGFFGVFKCVNKPSNYSFFGIELESNLATAVCFSIGMWVFSLHLAILLHLLFIGVASVYVLSSPMILYLAYPLVMFAFRKKCS